MFVWLFLLSSFALILFYFMLPFHKCFSSSLLSYDFCNCINRNYYRTLDYQYLSDVCDVIFAAEYFDELCLVVANTTLHDFHTWAKQSFECVHIQDWCIWFTAPQRIGFENRIVIIHQLNWIEFLRGDYECDICWKWTTINRNVWFKN